MDAQPVSKGTSSFGNSAIGRLLAKIHLENKSQNNEQKIAEKPTSNRLEPEKPHTNASTEVKEVKKAFPKFIDVRTIGRPTVPALEPGIGRGRDGSVGPGMRDGRRGGQVGGRGGAIGNFQEQEGRARRLGGVCYKCGADDHFVRECPQNPDRNTNCNRNGNRASGGCRSSGVQHSQVQIVKENENGEKRGCYKCGVKGHFARECPNVGGDCTGVCFNCGSSGHIARECLKQDVDEDDCREGPYVPPPPTEDEKEIFRAVHKGFNFEKFTDIVVECTGNNAIENPINNIEEADLEYLLMANVKRVGYCRLTPIQCWAIPTISQGRDLMGCAQTGSGKTAAFLLPVLTGMIRSGCVVGGQFMAVQAPSALVVAPTRELVLQIYEEARKFARGTIIRPAVLYGGTSVNHQTQQLNAGAHIVAGTPGRLIDVIHMGKLSLSNIKYLILDEADRMLDMGFMPDVKKIVFDLGMPPTGVRQTLMFSATFPPEIQELAKEFLTDYIFITVGMLGSACKDITQTILQVDKGDKKDQLIALLKSKETTFTRSGSEKVMIFTETKKQADFLATLLCQKQLPATSIHGDRQQREREEALRDFKANRYPILVATSVAARGLDIAEVDHVINYDIPASIDEYVHRIGRTGRCGNTGRATSFFDTEKDRNIARHLVAVLQQTDQPVPEWLDDVCHQLFLAEAAAAIEAEAVAAAAALLNAEGANDEENSSADADGIVTNSSNSDADGIITSSSNVHGDGTISSSSNSLLALPAIPTFSSRSFGRGTLLMSAAGVPIGPGRLGTASLYVSM